MLTFKEFIKKIDESQIDSLYNKAHVAVELAHAFDQSIKNKGWLSPPPGANTDLLKDISVIANLASGAYGVYNSIENHKIMPAQLQKSLIYYGRITPENLQKIPKMTIKRYYPQIKEDEIAPTNTIHVNIKRILQELPDDESRIKEISSTILHEATHSWENENKGTTNEAGPVATEHAFMNWVNGPGKQVLQSLMANKLQPNLL